LAYFRNSSKHRLDSDPGNQYLFDARRTIELFSPTMHQKEAITALAALAQETRLDLFRLLVTAGPGGLPAGAIAERLGVLPSSLSFHLAQLTHAGLIAQRRLGRQLIYSADYGAMNALLAYLTENCCGGGDSCIPGCDPRDAKTLDEAPARADAG
jgi:ArsR family transcriptional regulator, arsenate/arsenite/antimonite-responsive transcriptional repressor